jgi:NADH:ubiquinone oxidoreductase subunit H
MLIVAAYLTLFERHLLGLSQNRLGPNKTVWHAVLQPVLDALKLLQKKELTLHGADRSYYYLIPIFGFLLLFFHILVLPFVGYGIGFTYGGLLFLCTIGGSVYGRFFSGYSAKSKYAYLGAIRFGVQRISYEVCLFLLIFRLLRIGNSCHLIVGGNLIQIPLLIITFLAVLAELGRSPFDFTEGERELVRGYNLEFGGLLFIYLFLTEYARMFFFSRAIAASFLG